jgi:hypothetical protein
MWEKNVSNFQLGAWFVLPAPQLHLLAAGCCRNNNSENTCPGPQGDKSAAKDCILPCHLAGVSEKAKNTVHQRFINQLTKQEMLGSEVYLCSAGQDTE